MGIGEEAHVENEIGFTGQAKAVGKGGDENGQFVLAFDPEMALERPLEVRQRHLRGIDGDVGPVQYGGHQDSFAADPVADRPVIRQGVPAAGFLEPAAQNLVVAVQKQERHIHMGALDKMLQLLEEPGGVEITGPDVDADGNGMGKITGRHQTADQGYRKVVHRLVAQILEHL